MIENVLLTVKGRQLDLGEDAQTELLAGASYYFRNDKHFILYDDIDESGVQTGNTIKIAKDRVDVIRRGPDSVHMIFEKDKMMSTCYHTPAGDMLMDIQTSNIRTRQTEEYLETRIDYSLYLSGVFISACTVQIKVMFQGDSDIHLFE